MKDGDRDPQQIIEEKSLKQESDPKELEKLIDKVIKDNQDKVKEYKSGKDITYSRRLSSKAKKQVQETKTNKDQPKKRSTAREKLRAKNVKRLGKARVDLLIRKNKEFQAAKKDRKKMKAYREKYGK